MSVAFLLTTIAVAASPGTGVLYTVAAGLTRGRRASVVAAFGCTLGIVPHIAAALLGLAALLNASSLAFQTLRYLGACYLLLMAVLTLRERGPLQPDAAPAERTPSQIIVSAIVVNLLNPKLSIFFLAFLPQFIRPAEPHHFARMLELSGVFMLVTFVVFAGYGVFAAWARTRLLTQPRAMTWLRRTFAGAFVALGARLALTDR